MIVTMKLFKTKLIYHSAIIWTCLLGGLVIGHFFGQVRIKIDQNGVHIHNGLHHSGQQDIGSGGNV